MYRVLVALGAAFLLPSLALAQECVTYEKAKEILQGKYDEVEVGRALGGRGNYAIVLFTSKESGTWTLVRVTPENCVYQVDAGEGWSDVKPADTSL